MSDDWGPWIEHDGRGCPCLGMFCEVVRVAHPDSVPFPNGSYVLQHMLIIKTAENWDWSFFGGITSKGTIATKIISYRIRKPRGMKVLETILAELPNTPEKVSA